jgi:hypothetical protein
MKRRNGVSADRRKWKPKMKMARSAESRHVRLVALTCRANSSRRNQVKAEVGQE